MGKLNERLKAALEEATTLGDMDTVHALAGMLKKLPADEPEAVETQAVEPIAEETQAEGVTLPESLQGLIDAAYPDCKLEDYQTLEDGTGFVVVVDAEQFIKVPFATLEDGSYSLGEGEEVQPDPKETAEPTEAVQAKSKVTVKAKSVDPIELELVNNEPPKEFRIWAYGLVRTTKGDSVLTKENADAIIEFWRDKGTLLHFDYEHGTFSEAAEAGQPIPAAGWYKLDARDDGLYAVDIEWTAKAYAMIKSREYRYYSPAYDVDTETSQIVGYHNGAITNYPATKNIQVLMKAKAELEAVTAKQETEILKLRREAHNTKVLASVKELENAGIPTVIISRVRPLLEQMNTPTLTLTRDGKTTQTTAADILQSALLEMARIGIVRTGETTQRTETNSIALAQAVSEIRTAWAKDGKKNLREADIYLAARKKYPHLKEG